VKARKAQVQLRKREGLLAGRTQRDLERSSSAKRTVSALRFRPRLTSRSLAISRLDEKSNEQILHPSSNAHQTAVLPSLDSKS